MVNLERFFQISRGKEVPEAFTPHKFRQEAQLDTPQMPADSPG